MNSLIIDRYFGPYRNQVTIEGETARVANFLFHASGNDLIVSEYPREPFFEEARATMDDNVFTWHCVAHLKVRHFNSGADVIEKARTGAIYDEDYFTRRGGGGPYVGYPNTVHGENLQEGFAHFADELVSRLKPTKSLDLGCATGVLVRELQRRNVEAHGIDISEWCVKNAVAPHVAHGSVLKMPYADSTFDLITSQDVMEHIHPDDLATTLREQVRVSRNGGHICHFIPFYEYEEPKQIDVHLNNVNRKWWLDAFSKVKQLKMTQMAPETNQWDFSRGFLARYFVFEVTKN